MILANKTHITLLTLYGIVVSIAVGALVSQAGDASRLPLAVWAALGTVGASGAMLEILILIRTREALRQMKRQIEQLRHCAEVGLVMVDEQSPVEGLAGMLNEYLTLIRRRMNELARERRELDLLVRATDAEKHNTEAIVASICDAVVVINSYGELTLANRQAEELFGFKLAQVKNRPAPEVITEPKLAELLDPSRWPYRQPISFEHEITLPGGHDPKYVLVTVSPVFSRPEELWALAMTLHDVTQARQLAQLKNDFVHHVAHELRTPLSSIKAYIELLLDGDIATVAGRAEFYRIIDAEAERLDRFIENMLNLNRIESGMMAVEFSKVKLNDALDQSVALVRYLAREKSIELDNVPLPEPTWVWAGGDLLRQAVLNLLSNALKYTPTGGTVTLTAGTGEDGTSYWIRVADTGVGIAADELDRIFDKFYRCGNGRQLSGGTGLGLSLVKQVVEQIHGGRIEVDSHPGRGSTFTLHLPVQPAASDSTAGEFSEEASIA